MSSVTETVGSMSGDLQKILGRNLRKHREELGLSQEKFADLLECHRTYAGSIERGERNMSLGALESLAASLGVDPRDLLRD